MAVTIAKPARTAEISSVAPSSIWQQVRDDWARPRRSLGGRAYLSPQRRPNESDYEGIASPQEVHTLFDLGWISVHPESLRVVIHPLLKITSYQDLEGKRVALPYKALHRPSSKALRWHLTQSRIGKQDRPTSTALTVVFARLPARRNLNDVQEQNVETRGRGAIRWSRSPSRPRLSQRHYTRRRHH